MANDLHVSDPSLVGTVAYLGLIMRATWFAVLVSQASQPIVLMLLRRDHKQVRKLLTDWLRTSKATHGLVENK